MNDYNIIKKIDVTLIIECYMGNSLSIKKIGFEDIQYIFRSNKDHIIISTLSEKEQGCLIKNTVSPNNEVDIINKALGKISLFIVIYGRNKLDDSVYDKYRTLINHGFTNVFVYPGGLFEWVCLQDIYGEDNFPTTKRELDILKFKPQVKLNKLLLIDID